MRLPRTTALTATCLLSLHKGAATFSRSAPFPAPLLMSAVSVSADAADAAEPVPRGAFIVFEGVDRCGKTTQTKMLAESLPNAALMRFPDRSTSIGQMINGYLAQGVELDDRAVHLLFSANRWEASARIEQLLRSGTTIICDRYAYSGVAFSAAKDGLDVPWCASPDRGLPAPDCVVYLDLPVEAAMRRGEFGAERYEKETFQRQVAANFATLREQDATPWTVLDASRPIDALHAEIVSLVQSTSEAVRHTAIRRLWVDSAPAAAP